MHHYNGKRIIGKIKQSKENDPIVPIVFTRLFTFNMIRICFPQLLCFHLCGIYCFLQDAIIRNEYWKVS